MKSAPVYAMQVDNLLTHAEKLTLEAAYDSATTLARKALSVSRQSGYTSGRANAYDKLAEIMLLNGKMTEVRQYDSLILPLALQLKDTALLVNTRNRTGIYFMENGRHDEAEKNFMTALSLGLEEQQSDKTAQVYSNVASLHLGLGDKDQATEWFFKALRLYEKNNNDRGQGETYSNISSVFYLMGRLDEAIGYQKKSIFFREKQQDIHGLVISNINIGQLYILKDSMPGALHHVERAVQYAEQIQNPRLIGVAYSGMSAYYRRTNNLRSALVWQRKSIALFEETDDKQLLSRMYAAAGNLANTTGDSLASVEFYYKALALSKQLGNKENISNVYERLSDFYASHHDYKNAHENFQQYILYRDSITQTSTLARIEEIKTQYETEKKDNEIIRLNNDQRIKQLELEKQQAIITSNLQEARRKQNEIDLLQQAKELQDLRLKNQGEELERQRLIAKTNEQQLLLSEQEKELKEKEVQNQKQFRNATVAGASLLLLFGVVVFNRYQLKKKLEQQRAMNTIRNDIARDLHDEIGSTLTSINILSAVSQKNIERNKDKAALSLQQINEQTQTMQQAMSDIVWAIRADNDGLDNVVIRMREFISQTLESKGIAIVFNAEQDILKHNLPMEKRHDFFLIFKEAVNNAAKYAQASRVTITLNSTGHHLHLAVTDDGKGFDVNRHFSSNGIKNMRERASLLNGEISIRSAHGAGTTVELRFPTT